MKLSFPLNEHIAQNILTRYLPKEVVSDIITGKIEFETEPKRKKNVLLGGLWEFPGGKKIKKESITNCIKREILEELSINVDVSNFIIKVNHKYSHFGITLQAHHCFYKTGDIICNSADDWKWIRPNQLAQFPFPKANHYIFPYILNQKVA